MGVTRVFLKPALGMVLTLGLTCCGTTVQKPDGRVVLPNIKLTGCDSQDCSQIWPGKSSATNPAYPKHVSVDVDNGSIRALTAMYDQSVTMDEIRAAVDRRYGKWALTTNRDTNSHMKLWRVEPEKFAIGLSEQYDGTKLLFYLAFRPNAHVYQDMINAMIQSPSDCEAGARGYYPRSTPKDATAASDEVLHRYARIGEEVTIRGKFSIAGKFGPYVSFGNHQGVYIEPTGSFTWGEPYPEIEGKLVEATGILLFYHSPNPEPTGPSPIARGVDHFYFKTAQLRLISP